MVYYVPLPKSQSIQISLTENTLHTNKVNCFSLSEHDTNRLDTSSATINNDKLQFKPYIYTSQFCKNLFHKRFTIFCLCPFEVFIPITKLKMTVTNDIGLIKSHLNKNECFNCFRPRKMTLRFPLGIITILKGF